MHRIFRSETFPRSANSLLYMLWSSVPFTLKTETEGFSETSALFYLTTQHHIPENSNIYMIRLYSLLSFL